MKAAEDRLMEVQEKAEKLKDGLAWTWFFAWEAEVNLDTCPMCDFGCGSADYGRRMVRWKLLRQRCVPGFRVQRLVSSC